MFKSEIKSWVRICIFNLMIVAILGSLMRFKIAFEFPFFVQKNLLHSHSHFALFGWISFILMILIANNLGDTISEKDTKQFRIIFIGSLICAYGMLITNKYLNGVPDDSRVAKGEGTLKVEQITPAALSKVRKLNDLAISRGQSLAQMAIAWDLRDERVSSVLIGASSVAQIDDSLSALKNKHFSQEELNFIDDILKG
jgi:hypothetical protein